MPPTATPASAVEDSPAPSRARRSGPIAQRDRIGLAVGYAANQGPHNAVHTLSHQVLNVTVGMNPALINALIFLQRAWGAVLDPIFGQYSDNLRTRYGRRRPLLFGGAFPIAIGFAAFWAFPVHAPEPWRFAYLLAASLTLYGGISLHAVALGSLQIEVTTEYNQRTRLAAFIQLCFLGFTIAVQWLYPAIQRCTDPVAGARTMGIWAGAAFLAAALCPAFLVREPRYREVADRQRPARFKAGIRCAAKNGPFLRLLIASGAANLGFFLASFFGVYLNYYSIFPGRTREAAIMQAWLGTGFQVAAFLSVFAYRWLAVRWGKRLTFQIAACAHIVSSAAKLVLYQPAHPWLQLVIYVLNGVAFAGVALLATSMLADVADWEEWRTGRRSEGWYCSILAWGDKFCASIGILVCGLVFGAIGFRSGIGALQSPASLRLMQLCYAGFPFAGAVVAIVAIARYPLSERAVASLRCELERRRDDPFASWDTTRLPASVPGRG